MITVCCNELVVGQIFLCSFYLERDREFAGQQGVLATQNIGGGGTEGQPKHWSVPRE